MAPISALLAVGAAAQYVGQGGDGNPHNWDRRRRCDHSQYSPTCGPCEGYGGIPYGDENDERVPAAPAAFPPPPRARRPAPRRRITLTSCEVVANKSDVDPATLAAPVWGRSWVSGTYFEVLIGPKLDPFCFSVIPSNSSEGGLCYRADYGSQWYDMLVGMIFLGVVGGFYVIQSKYMPESLPKSQVVLNVLTLTVGLAYFFWALIHTLAGSFDGGVLSFPVAVAASLYGAGVCVLCCAFQAKFYRVLAFCGFGAVLLNYGIIALIVETDDGWTMLIYLIAGMAFWLAALVAAFVVTHVAPTGDETAAYAKIPGEDVV